MLNQWPVEYLDLEALANKRAVEEIDWEKVKRLREQDPPLWLSDTFQAAICNPESCPIGWEGCRRRDWGSCHYYAILRAKLAQKGEPIA